MAGNIQALEIVHPRPAEVAVAQQKSTGLDHIHGHAQTSAKPHHGPRILRNVRLVERQAQRMFSTWSKIRADKAFSAASCRKTLEIRLSILPRGRANFGLFRRARKSRHGSFLPS